MTPNSRCRNGLTRARQAALRRVVGGAVAVALAAALGLAGAVGGRPDAPADELRRLQYLGRVQPEIASTALLRYVDTLGVDDPRHLEGLLEVGSQDVMMNRGEAVEQVAARLEALSDRVPLARPAAMLLRGQWMQRHGEVSKAERQIIEASALLPANPPDFLRLRVLTSSAYLKNRGGHYAEALARYDQALKLADERGPTWQRVDLRAAIAGVYRDAGQADRAAETNREEMRLAVEAHDEFGISAAYTTRAMQGTDAGSTTAVLADWRAALEHARLGGSKHQIVMGMANIADYYLQHGDFQTAYDLSQKALPLAVEAHDLPAQSVAMANTGLALIGMRRLAEGLPLVRQSASIDESTGTATAMSDAQRELGGYLERAGYLDEALAAYHLYRQLSDELYQQDRQRAMIELQEGIANEARRHELAMLAREGRLKDEEILHHQLQVRQWTAVGVTALLLMAVVAALARRLRVRNRLLRASNEQLRLQAEIDPLTGLSNRHHLQAVMAGRGGAGLQGTLYLLDVDHFKQINDRCGHAGGDAVLVEIARRLREALRDDDLVVRWGGEEFLVLVRPLPQGEAEALARRLLAALADAPVVHEGQAVPVSASIGFSRFPLRTSVPQAELALPWERAIALADAAMYLAKARGRNAACGVLRLDVDGAARVEEVVAHLERAAQAGRVALGFQHGPVVQRSPVRARGPAAAAEATS